MEELFYLLKFFFINYYCINSPPLARSNLTLGIIRGGWFNKGRNKIKKKRKQKKIFFLSAIPLAVKWFLSTNMVETFLNFARFKIF